MLDNTKYVMLYNTYYPSYITHVMLYNTWYVMIWYDMLYNKWYVVLYYTYYAMLHNTCYFMFA